MYWEFTDGTKIEKTRENMLNLVSQMYNDMIENEIYFKGRSDVLLKCIGYIESDCFACDFLRDYKGYGFTIKKQCKKCPFSIYAKNETYNYSCISDISPYSMYEDIYCSVDSEQDLSKSDKKKIRKICFEICQLFIDAE